MMGWVALGLLFVAAVALLWLMRVRGSLLVLATAFLLLGCAGYALQGSPGQPDSPTAAAPSGAIMPMAPLRHAFFGEFTPEEAWLVMSDSYANQGDTEEAVGIMTQAVRLHPGDPELWIGLGNALMDHAGIVTPAAQYAYKRAAELVPGHPAPLYFFALALARSGDRADALTIWHDILADAPADASWRPIVENSIALLSDRSGK